MHLLKYPSKYNINPRLTFKKKQKTIAEMFALKYLGKA